MNAHKHPNENNAECDASCYGSISALDGLSFLVVKILAQRLFISYAESSLSEELKRVWMLSMWCNVNADFMSDPGNITVSWFLIIIIGLLLNMLVVVHYQCPPPPCPQVLGWLHTLQFSHLISRCYFLGGHSLSISSTLTWASMAIAFHQLQSCISHAVLTTLLECSTCHEVMKMNFIC